MQYYTMFSRTSAATFAVPMAIQLCVGLDVLVYGIKVTSKLGRRQQISCKLNYYHARTQRSTHSVPRLTIRTNMANMSTGTSALAGVVVEVARYSSIGIIVAE